MINHDSWTLDSIVEVYKHDQRRVRGLREPTLKSFEDGHVYVLQGYKVKTEDLATLGDKFKQLPEGWKYQVVSPTEDIVMNLTPAHAIPSVQDEFDQIYIRIPE